MEQSFNIVGWNGGPCPMHLETKAHYWLRNGDQLTEKAANMSWLHDKVDHENDIIAYQVVTPYVEQKVVWVNEHLDGMHYAYDTEVQAKICRNRRTKRVAVKYQEVRD